MKPCASLPLSSRPHCHNSLLSSLWTHPNQAKPYCQNPGLFFFIRRWNMTLGRAHCWFTYRANFTEKSGFHLKSSNSLLKLNQLYFLLDGPSLDKNKVFLAFLLTGIQFGNWIPSLMLIPATGFSLSCSLQIETLLDCHSFAPWSKARPIFGFIPNTLYLKMNSCSHWQSWRRIWHWSNVVFCGMHLLQPTGITLELSCTISYQ